MIAEQDIRALVEEHIGGTGIFLVEVRVGSGNDIRVIADSPEGISIDECAGISRFLNGRLDREEEDYSLEVSSPGLDAPFRVRQQYEKNVGRKVEVILKDGDRLEGKLISVTGDSVTLNLKGRDKTVRLDEIKKAKTVITFN
jgi:ribosome maturation factor RimP